MNDLPLLPSVCIVPLDYGWVCVCARKREVGSLRV